MIPVSTTCLILLRADESTSPGFAPMDFVGNLSGQLTARLLALKSLHLHGELIILQLDTGMLPFSIGCSLCSCNFR